jgi:transposase
VLAMPGVLREVAERFGVSQAYVCRVRSRRDKLGQTSAGAQHNHRLLRLAALEPALREQVSALPTQTLHELCHWARDVHGVQVAISTMHKTLRRFGVTLKKNHPARRRADATRRRSGAHGLEGRTTRLASGPADFS